MIPMIKVLDMYFSKKIGTYVLYIGHTMLAEKKARPIKKFFVI